MPDTTLQNVVQRRYGEAAKDVMAGRKASCCGTETVASPRDKGPITSNLYGDEQVAELPEDAVAASLGCGNPTALAELKAGETVLDLGSGGGIDVLLSARRVGPTGKAYGLDMTPDMLELARRNQAEAGVTNAEFLQGTIEAIPLPDASVDVIISNCVINLSGDKDKVLREAFRVLKPGGRFAVSDIVVRRELPEGVRKSMELWTGCIAGALVDKDYVAKLTAAGFVDVDIEPTRIYGKNDVEAMASKPGACCGGGTAEAVEALQDSIASAFIRAKKPATAVRR